MREREIEMTTRCTSSEKKKQGGDGTNSNLVGPKALMTLHNIAQQMRRDGISPTAAVKNCRQGGGGWSWEEEEGRREVGPRSLPLLSFVALWRFVRAYTVPEKERLAHHSTSIPFKVGNAPLVQQTPPIQTPICCCP